MISWDCTKAEYALIVKIARRAERIYAEYAEPPHTAIMDINACHSNGCPLRLHELLTAEDGDFNHDISGIRRAVNRETGKLTEDPGFTPRYATFTKGS